MEREKGCGEDGCDGGDGNESDNDEEDWPMATEESSSSRLRAAV